MQKDLTKHDIEELERKAAERWTEISSKPFEDICEWALKFLRDYEKKHKCLGIA